MSDEAESGALTEWLRHRSARIASVIGRVELTRAARRVAAATGETSVVDRVASVLASVTLTGVSDAIADRAGMAQPSSLRSLDALHLATAFLAGPLEAFVTYDRRLAEAARSAGLAVVQPGLADAEPTEEKPEQDR